MVKLVSLILIGTFAVSSALDLKLSKEGPCNKDSLVSIPLDKSVFENATRIWYNPIITKYELYSLAEDLYKRRADKISDEDLKTLCPVYTINEGGSPFSFDSFGNFGTFAPYEGDKGENNTIFWKSKGHKDWDAKGYVTKAEEDYFVLVSCWADGAKTVSVNSKVKKFNDDVRKEIVDHIKTLGFDDKYIYDVNYDDCDKAVQEGYCTKECAKNNYLVK